MKKEILSILTFSALSCGVAFSQESYLFNPPPIGIPDFQKKTSHKLNFQYIRISQDGTDANGGGISWVGRRVFGTKVAVDLGLGLNGIVVDSDTSKSATATGTVSLVLELELARAGNVNFVAFGGGNLMVSRTEIDTDQQGNLFTTPSAYQSNLYGGLVGLASTIGLGGFKLIPFVYYSQMQGEMTTEYDDGSETTTDLDDISFTSYGIELLFPFGLSLSSVLSQADQASGQSSDTLMLQLSFNF